VSAPQAPIVGLSHSITPEDKARADFYALLSRLYAAAPDAALLRAIAGADALPIAVDRGPALDLATSWGALGAASAAMDAAAAAEEYQDLFIGVGKSEVSLHASAYLPSTGRSELATVRATLGDLGLGRKSGVNVYEDHLSAVCETMRVLIAGGAGLEPFALADQRRFFEAHLASWVFACCTAIKACPIANYYRRVGQFTEFFVVIERDSFTIE
jgi:TorA maturation chaperone TorD